MSLPDYQSVDKRQNASPLPVLAKDISSNVKGDLLIVPEVTAGHRADETNTLKSDRVGFTGSSGTTQITVQSCDTVAETSPGPNKSSAHEDERRIIINVGGNKHEALLATLLKIPKTRLYKVAMSLVNASDAEESQRKTPEIFFDRDPCLFGFILNFYRTDQLHVPLGVCGPMFKQELDFWELDEREIEPCCYVTYVSYEETNEALAQFDYSVKDSSAAAEQTDYQVTNGDGCWHRWRPKIWKGLHNPYSSKPATVYAVVSLLVVLVSITLFVIETLPYFGVHTLHSRKKAENTWTSEDLQKDLEIFTDINSYDILIIIDNCCNIFFFVEYVVKLLAAQSKVRYIRSPISVIELLCIIPYYLAMVIVYAHPDPIELFDLLRVLYATRVLRIFRIFVLMKHFMALKILVYTIKASTKELLLLVLILIIGVVIFACIEYYAELLSEDENDVSDFSHIPIAFWWALVTMTTVGYGDVVPKTVFGYVVGAFCAISGVLVVALTVPIIVNNFSVYYTHAQSREKLKLRKKQMKESKQARDHWKHVAGVSKSFGMFRHRANIVPAKSQGTAHSGENGLKPDNEQIRSKSLSELFKCSTR